MNSGREVLEHIRNGVVPWTLTRGEAARVYVLGPMRGYPEFNHPAFDAATKLLRDQGFEVINPAEEDRRNGIDFGHLTGDQQELDELGWSVNQALAVDLAIVCLWADFLVALPGWEASKGAQAEVAAARAIGKMVFRLGLDGSMEAM
jgi:hypothetical protein